MALEKACPKLKILEADTIPETSDMTTAAEQMIGQGAKIIFSTSYGYKDFAVSLADKHSDVAVLQQGNFINPPLPANANTYFGNVYETVYLAGIAAGKATKTGQARLRRRVPDPADAAEHQRVRARRAVGQPEGEDLHRLHRQLVRPGQAGRRRVEPDVAGVDVLTQHQDCTSTIIKAAEAKGKYSVGYHYDAESLAPKGWLTGSEWNWGPLYESMVASILNGKFTAARSTRTTRSASRARRSRRRWSSRRTARRSRRRRRS